MPVPRRGERAVGFSDMKLVLWAGVGEGMADGDGVVE